MNSSPIIEIFPELSEYSEADFFEARFKKPVVFVAMTARTGSTHLCFALSQVARFGVHDIVGPRGAFPRLELFNPRGPVPRLLAMYGVSTYREYVRKINEDDSDYLLIKSNWIDFEIFSNAWRIILPDAQFVYLDRNSIEAQAVSLFKAVVREEWHRRKGGASSIPFRDDSEVMAAFDLERICGLIGELSLEKIMWNKFFYHNDIKPMRISYEDFQSDLNMAIRKIVSACGIVATNIEVRSDFVRLSDAINDLWLERLMDYRGGAFFGRNSHKETDLL